LMMKHRISLQLFDDICSVVNDYMSSPEFSAMSLTLSTNVKIVKSIRY
jgi:hypothetical protein